MKNSAIRRIAIGTLCAGLLAVAGVASAGDWEYRGSYRPSGIRLIAHGPTYGPGIRGGVGVQLYSSPIYVDPCYDPYYGEPSVGVDVVVGGGYFGRGRTTHGEGRRGGYGHGGGASHNRRHD